MLYKYDHTLYRLCILSTSSRSIMRLAFFVLILAPAALAQSAAERMLQDYFGQQTKRVAERALAGIHSLEDRKVRRETYREQIREMLGLPPLPARTELKVTVAGKAESEKFVQPGLDGAGRKIEDRDRRSAENG
jgi:hypothetical protein